MIDPRQAQALLAAAAGQAQPDTDSIEARARQGRLSFAATIAALRAQCSCEACGFLRQAVDLLLADAKKDLASHAPGHNP